MVNAVGGGYPGKGYEDLDDSALILVCAPAQSVGPIVSALASAIHCRGKTILLCDGGADSRQLGALQSQGARTGSLQVIPGFDGRRFLAEGDPAAVREAKNLGGQSGGTGEKGSSATPGDC